MTDSAYVPPVVTPADTLPAEPAQTPASAFSITDPGNKGGPAGFHPTDTGVAGPAAVYTGGGADAGGGDKTSGSVAGAVAAAMAWQAEHSSDTYSQGSNLGDLMDLPEVPGQHSKHAGGDDEGYPT